MSQCPYICNYIASDLPLFPRSSEQRSQVCSTRKSVGIYTHVWYIYTLTIFLRCLITWCQRDQWLQESEQRDDAQVCRAEYVFWLIVYIRTFLQMLHAAGCNLLQMQLVRGINGEEVGGVLWTREYVRACMCAHIAAPAIISWVSTTPTTPMIMIRIDTSK